MHEIHVSVVSPEKASHGVAELWRGGELLGFTRLDDGELVLRLEPRADGGAIVVETRALVSALAPTRC